MDFLIRLHTIQSGWSIVCIEGMRGFRYFFQGSPVNIFLQVYSGGPIVSCDGNYIISRGWESKVFFFWGGGGGEVSNCLFLEKPITLAIFQDPGSLVFFFLKYCIAFSF